MADDAKQAWMRVGERFGSVGKKLADRYKEGAAGEAAATEGQNKLEEVAKELLDRVERAVDAVDGTVRDPGARTDVKEALNALGDALTVTAKDVEAAVRRGGESKQTPPPGDASAGGTPADETPSG
jgi:hypothetical protein